MTREQFLLIKLSEECAEVSQRALKQVQFGASEIQIGQPYTNAHRLRSELMDLCVLTVLLEEAGQFAEFDWDEFQIARASKVEKLQKYANYSRSLGTLPEIKI